MYYRLKDALGSWAYGYDHAWRGAVAYVRELVTPGSMPYEQRVFELGVLGLGVVVWGIMLVSIVRYARR